MDINIITGRVISDIKIINTDNGAPFCRFTLLSDNRKLNCLIAGAKAFNFLYEVETNTNITISFVFNKRNQLVVRNFKVLNGHTYPNQLFEYKGRKIPHKKVMY